MHVYISLTVNVLTRHMGTISHSFDRETGIITIVGEGVYTFIQAQEHFAALAALVSSVRSKRGRVKVLIDTARSAVQPANVAEKIEKSIRSLYTPQDRVALIVASTLHKVQMRRIADPKIIHLFISRDAALTWLRAYEG